jgi:MOSC domain-containing protein YiiM
MTTIMRVKTVFVGGPQDYSWKGQTVTTSFFKKPVTQTVSVSAFNIDGDKQSDLTVHGGEFKAVYSYDQSNYVWWEKNHPEYKYEDGCFGENLLTEGLDEEKICLGDQFQIGSVVLEAAQPRQPCYKLGLRFQDDKIIRHFHNAARWGLYFRVVQPGKFTGGDTIKLVSDGATSVKIYEIPKLLAQKSPDMDKVQALIDFKHVCPRMRQRFLKKIP